MSKKDSLKLIGDTFWEETIMKQKSFTAKGIQTTMRCALMERLLRYSGLVIWILCCAFVPNAHAQFEGFSPGFQYDSGYNPSVTSTAIYTPGIFIPQSCLIEVHNGQATPGPMWYHVGEVNFFSGDATWSPDAYEYDSGWNPSVAAAGVGNMVVEVHNGQGTAGKMWYHVGQVNCSNYTVSWGPSIPYDTGWNPSISMSGSTVVEVHNGQGTAGEMWYHVGAVVNLPFPIGLSEIIWGPSYPYDQGFNPQIALVGLTAIEVHNGHGVPGQMWYHVGQISGQKINWGPSIPYDSGWNPKVSFNGTQIIEVHNGQQVAGQMWYDSGNVNGSAIDWLNIGGKFDSGFNPSVAFVSGDNNNGNEVINVHNGGNGAGPEWYNLGVFYVPPQPPPQ